ncbi:Metallo-hydrolase/oxidoreductase [Coprinellus micaceus]|uniref:Metallo-hydrolase/oxidoreductase n=1 Tax=Coprinellus micaceus TaxID=71717 RepID=A0A4Y7SNG8_COPMI|nr:Metallo-hydrolase/oxidoreductase [Coprinellus micaceus]
MPGSDDCSSRSQDSFNHPSAPLSTGRLPRNNTLHAQEATGWKYGAPHPFRVPTCSTCPNTPGQPNVYSFFESATSTWQYIVTDPTTKKAVIVDPVLDFNAASGAITTKTADGLLGFVKENGFEVIMLLETHAHADHITAAQYLKQKLGGVPVGIGKRITGVQERFGKIYEVPKTWWDGAFDKYFEDDERFMIGDLECQVMHLPGTHPGPRWIYVRRWTLRRRHALLPRADFPGGSPMDLYNSIQRVLAMSPNTRIYAGHDYPPEGSKQVGERCWSLVSEQRLKNVHLKARLDEIAASSSPASQTDGSEGLAERLMNAFIEWRAKRDSGLGAPRLIHPSLQVNICAGKLPKPDAQGMRMLKIPLQIPEGL